MGYYGMRSTPACSMPLRKIGCPKVESAGGWQLTTFIDQTDPRQTVLTLTIRKVSLIIVVIWC